MHSDRLQVRSRRTSSSSSDSSGAGVSGSSLSTGAGAGASTGAGAGASTGAGVVMVGVAGAGVSPVVKQQTAPCVVFDCCRFSNFDADSSATVVCKCPLRGAAARTHTAPKGVSGGCYERSRKRSVVANSIQETSSSPRLTGGSLRLCFVHGSGGGDGRYRGSRRVTCCRTAGERYQ